MNIRDHVDSEQIKQWTKRNNLKAIWMLVVNWAMILGAFAIAGLFPNLLTILIAILILANRQLGLGILMHDCAHNGLFTNKKVNEWVGHWLCAGPIYAQLVGYRNYHLKHHKTAGTDQDPDYPNYKHYPIAKASLKRKIIRDFVGITGIKLLYILMLMNIGKLDYDMAYKASAKGQLQGWDRTKFALINHLRFIIPHMMLVAGLYALGIAWTYSLWWIAVVFVNPFYARIRNAAEHASTPNLLDPNPLMHTRTTYANWWEKLTFAPNHVNFHLEHHLLASVPPYNLKKVHNYLIQKGLLEDAQIASGYIEVIQSLTKDAPTATVA